MTTCKDWFISFVGGVLLASNAFAAGLTFKVTPATILPGERARIQIRLEDSAAAQTDDSADGEALPVINDKFLDMTPDLRVLDRVFRKEDGAYVWEYQVTAHKLLNLRIPPFEVQDGPNTFSTEAADLKVVSSRMEGDDVERPEYDEVPMPFDWKRWWRLTGLFVLATSLFGAGLWFFEKWKKTPVTRKALEPTADEHPLVWFRRELDQLKKRVHDAPASPYDLDALTTILRGYYSRETKNPVETWTSGEFRQRFAADPNAQKISLLFERMDHARFVPVKNASVGDMLSYCIVETERALLPWTA